MATACIGSDRAAGSVLPDVLAPNLHILFCGTAAGAVSAAKQAYYAGPGNGFWRTLFEVGLTPQALEPCDYARVAEWNMGFTDLAKRVSGGDHMLSSSHFDRARLRRVIQAHAPKIVAFTGKRAAQEYLGRPVRYGMLEETEAATRLFVLPSPSGAARRYWDGAPWRELSRLRAALGGAGLESGSAGTIPAPLMRP